MVWAIPFSFATTWGITIVFFSTGYLDVSVLRVCIPKMECSDFIGTGCPIRKSADQIVFANPRSLSQLIASFIASESQGILHTLLVTFLKMSLYFWYSCYSFKMSKNGMNFGFRVVDFEFYRSEITNPYSAIHLWRISDSNRWPPACKASALASWANPPIHILIWWFSDFLILNQRITESPNL